MPLLEQVRELGRAEARLDEETIRAARTALTREIARGGRAKDPVRARRRRRWSGFGIGGLVAGVAATAIVLGSVLAPPATPSASAKEVLNAAAEQAALRAIEPAPGQFIRIQETGVQRLWWAPDTANPAGGTWGVNPTETGGTVRSARSLYVPADRSQDWIEDYRESVVVSDIHGPDAASARSDAAQQALTEAVAPFDVRVFPGGTYTQPDAIDPAMKFHRDWMQPYYEAMPRDPGALVEWMKKQKDGVLTRFGDAVDFDLAPADLRAAMFRALALIPGAKVEKVEGDVATIVYPDGGESNWPQTVLVDTRQGLLVGRGGGDADTGSSHVSVTIVDKIPESVQIPAN